MDRFIREIAITEIDGVSMDMRRIMKQRQAQAYCTLNGAHRQAATSAGEVRRREKRRLQTA